MCIRDRTYGKPQYLPVDIKHPQNPFGPYGQSKKAVSYTHLLNKCVTEYYVKAIQQTSPQYFRSKNWSFNYKVFKDVIIRRCV